MLQGMRKCAFGRRDRTCGLHRSPEPTGLRANSGRPMPPVISPTRTRRALLKDCIDSDR